MLKYGKISVKFITSNSLKIFKLMTINIEEKNSFILNFNCDINNIDLLCIGTFFY